MYRSDLQSVIEALLDKIADANGYGKGARTRYAPLRGTQYTKVGKTLFPVGRLPEVLMKEDLFLDIRSALVGVKCARGWPCLNTDDLAQLDRAWESYRTSTLIAPQRLHARWEELANEHNIRPNSLGCESDVYWTLYPILYVPMLLGQVDIFNKNNQAFLSGFATRHPAFPTSNAGRRLVLIVYLVVAAFCHRRLNQIDGQMRCIGHMKALLRNERHVLMEIEMLAHDFYDDPTTTAALRAYGLARDAGMSDRWSDWDGYALGRAAISAINLGYRKDVGCDVLGGLTPIDAINKTSDILAENGNAIQAVFFSMETLLPCALEGNLDAVYKGTTDKAKQAKSILGESWHITEHVLGLRAIGHYQVSGGRPADIIQARQYVDQIGPYLRSKKGGIVKKVVDEIINASDLIMT